MAIAIVVGVVVFVLLLLGQRHPAWHWLGQIDLSAARRRGLSSSKSFCCRGTYRPARWWCRLDCGRMAHSQRAANKARIAFPPR